MSVCERRNEFNGYITYEVLVVIQKQANLSYRDLKTDEFHVKMYVVLNC